MLGRTSIEAFKRRAIYRRLRVISNNIIEWAMYHRTSQSSDSSITRLKSLNFAVNV